jgi:hypothetical protein
MAIHTIRYRFGDFKIPNNFIILSIVAIIIFIIFVIINNPVKPPPVYTEANIKLLNDYNNQLKYYIVDNNWAISYPLSDIIPGITFGTDLNSSPGSDLFLDVDYGKGIQRFVDRNRNLKEYYRVAVDAINKFNEGTGLHIDKLV